MRGIAERAVLLAAGLAAAATCGPTRRGELVDRPVALETVAEHRGERLFFRHCAKCHPGGEAGLGPALNNKPIPAFVIRQQIRRGLGAMPAFSPEFLPDADVAAITAYVTTLRRAPRQDLAPPAPDDRPETARR
jgi:mono/diheme cytochrome c family protein